jgi:preprotein translocase subunit SecY
MSNLKLESKHNLELKLKQLEYDYAIAKQGLAVRGLGGLAMLLVFVGMMSTKFLGAFTFLKRGEGFIGGKDFVLLAIVVCLGLFLFYSLVLSRTARIRAEISKTKKSLEVVSGDKAR